MSRLDGGHVLSGWVTDFPQGIGNTFVAYAMENEWTRGTAVGICTSSIVL